MIEALFPEPTITLQPVGGVLERTGFELARSPLRLAPARDQTGALQHLEVLGNGGKAHGKGLGQLYDRGRALGEARQDCAPGGIGKGREGGTELIGRYVVINLSVK